MTDHPLDEPVVTLERTYHVDRELVWRAWTDTSILQRWYGCAPDQLWRIHHWDPRPGGRVHVSMSFDDPQGGDPIDYHVRGEFVVVEPPSRLVYTFGEGQRIEVAIDAATGSAAGAPDTVVTIRHHGVPPDGPPPAEMAGILDAGWTASLAQLVHQLSTAATERLVMDYWRSWQGATPDWSTMRAALADEIDTAAGVVAADALVAIARGGTPWRDVELVESVVTDDRAALLYRGVDTASDEVVDVAEFLTVAGGRITRLRGILPFS